jgi:hypothetical protein
MKKNKTTISLVAKVIGGTLFLAVFLFNVGSFVKKDAGGVSITALRAYADDGEGGDEEDETKYETIDTTKTVTTTTSVVDGKACKKKKTCISVACSGSGGQDCTPSTTPSCSEGALVCDK